MEFVSGEILTENGFKKGFLGFENNKIVEIGSSNPSKKPVCKGIIVPSFVNAHTHIGDSFIRSKNVKFSRNIDEMVAPPDGLKHKLLKTVSNEEISNGMKQSINIMRKKGTRFFCDFREGGMLGLNQLKSTLKPQVISAIILSRPASLVYNKSEVDLLLKHSEGVGISSISDWDYSELKKIARHTKKQKKIFALHASEQFREDIDLVLDLKPDFLVHMVKAKESDFVRVKENSISIVLCPRSNSFFGLKPDVKLMKKVGVKLLLGTDNVMLNTPDVLDDLDYLKKATSVFSVEQLLNMITYNPRKVLNLTPSILCPNSPAEFIVLDKKTLKTLYIYHISNEEG